MILEGAKLAFIGMAMVFSFLVLLVLLVHASTHLLKRITAQEVMEEALQGAGKAEQKKTRPDDGMLIAVVSAAVSAHRARMQRLRS